MLREHLKQVRDLIRENVCYNGERRAVRLFLAGDYESLCIPNGHKGPSGAMPYLMCFSTKAPGAAHADLEGRFGTLRDVKLPAPSNLQSSFDFEAMVVACSSDAQPRETTAALSQDGHQSNSHGYYDFQVELIISCCWLTC